MDNDKMYFQVLSRIAEKREEKNISKAQIAKELSITSRTYFALEKGDSKITLEQLIKISDFLEVDLKWLLFGDSKEEKEDSLVAYNPNDIASTMNKLESDVASIKDLLIDLVSKEK